jgi:DNA primase
MDAVEDIKSRLSIEDVVGRYVELKRAGRNLKGLSPWTSERTASFIVSPEKQIWHDFSSGKGGDMFSFVMEADGLDFRGALEVLARQAGVDLEQYRGGVSGKGKEKERLYEAAELAARFYQVQFSKSNLALEYVIKKRQFSKQTALTWRLGYSPNTGSALVEFLKSKKFTDHEIRTAGLSSQRGGDMFRGRLMVPLADPQGRVIGFTARLLVDDPNAPKYINTPATPIYDKSRHVFGLHLAKDALRKEKYAVIAEGNLDVIASHQADVRQVVATAGTALTEYQLKAISRFTPDIRLAFDADHAGVNATERSIPIASKVGVSLSIITIPSGKDPDELIKQDAGRWRSAIEKPQYAVDWLIERYKKELDISSAPGKREFSDVILNVVRGLADSVEQEHYLNQLSELIGVSPAALSSKLRNDAPKPSVKPKKTAVNWDKTTAEWVKTENHFLALMLAKPELRELLEDVKPQMLIEDRAKDLLVSLSKDVQNRGEYAKMLSLLYDELYRRLDVSEQRYEAALSKANLVKIYVSLQKKRIAHELESADDGRSQKLLETAKRLDNLLNKYKGGQYVPKKS